MARNRMILFLLFTMLIHKVSAIPMYTEFKEMIRNSKHIFIGTYTGWNGKSIFDSDSYHFEVTSVLKGNPGDKITLGRSESGGFYNEIGFQYLVFVNSKGDFEWVGHFMDINSTTDNSMLYLEGFCDFNAHIVSPANLSLGQLKQYINTGSYSGKIHGYLNFFSSSSKKMEPSPIYIEASYTYKDSLTTQVNVNGIALNDFVKVPYLYLPFHEPIVTIEYDRNLYRPLSFEGRVNNKQTDGLNWEIDFYVESPEEISYEDFKTYMSNSKLRPPTFEFLLKTETNEEYKLSLETYGDTYLVINGQLYENYGMQLAPKRILTFKKNTELVYFEMDSSKVAKKDLEDLSLHHLLIRELLYGPINGILKKDGKEIKATLSYQSGSLKRKMPN